MKNITIWKPIGMGKYEVSNQGEVRIVKTGQAVKPFTDKLQGYDRVDMYEGGRRIRVMVHTLVASAFIGPKPAGCEIDHINTNIHDNRMCNLKYVTRTENRNNPITRLNRVMWRIKRVIASGKKSQDEIKRLENTLKAFCDD